MSISNPQGRRSAALIVVNFLLAALIGCDTQNQRTAFDHLQDATAYRQSGELKAASIELKNALAKEPQNTGVRLFLGSVYNELGDYRSAEKEITRAADFGAAAREVLPELAKALLGLQEYDRLIEDVVPTTELKPNDLVDVHVARASAFLHTGDLGNAESSLKSAEKIDPGHAGVLLQRAKLSYTQGRKEDAVAYSERALAKDPERLDAWYVKAALLVADGKRAEAAEAYEQILKRDDRQLIALWDLSGIKAASGDYAAAEKLLAKAESFAEQDPRTRLVRAQLELRRGDYAAANAAATDVLRNARDNTSALRVRGISALRQGELETAFDDLTTVVSRVPGDLPARRSLALTQFRMGKLDDALTTLEPFTGDATPDVRSLALAGEILLRKGEFEPAFEMLERAAQLAPQARQLQERLVMGRLFAGDSAGALADLADAGAGDAAAPQNPLLLALTYLQNKDFDKVLTTTESLGAELRDTTLAHYLRGDAYLGKNETERARIEFKRALDIAPVNLRAAAKLAELDLRAKQPAKAREHFVKILAHDEKNVGAMIALANFAAMANEKREFVRWLGRAIETQPKAMRPYQLLTRYYLNQREPREALRVAQRAMRVRPESPSALELLGVAQMSVGDLSSAISSFRRLVDIKPAEATPHYLLGLAYKAAGDQDAARRALAKALEIVPDYAPTKDHMMLVELASGNKDQALAIARKMQEEQPESVVGFVREGDIHFKTLDYQAAALAYERGLSIGENGDLLVKWHMAKLHLKEAGAASKRLADWLAEHPEDVNVRRYLAGFYLQGDDIGAAIREHEALLAAIPDDITTLNNLAWLYQKVGDRRMLLMAERAFKLAPDNPAVQDTYAWVLLNNNRAAEARDLLAKTLTKTGDPSTLYHYALALAETGDPESAKRALEKLLQSGKEFPEKAQARAMLKQL